MERGTHRVDIVRIDILTDCTGEQNRVCGELVRYTYRKIEGETTLTLWNDADPLAKRFEINRRNVESIDSDTAGDRINEAK